MKRPERVDPDFVARFLSGMPADIAGSFDERQLFAVQQAFGRPGTQERRRGWHRSVALPWGRYRVSVAAEGAPDRRAAAAWRMMLRGAVVGAVVVGLLAGGALLALGSPGMAGRGASAAAQAEAGAAG